MRLLSLSSVALGVSFLATATCDSRAVAQIEFARSTIRITSNSEPAPPVETAPVQRPQQEIARQQQANPYVAETTEEPAPTPPPTAPRVPIRRYDVRPANYAAPSSGQPTTQSQMPGRAPSLVGVYSGASARATLHKMPGPAPVQPKGAAPPKHPRGKPFQSLQSNDPAVSPYLNMYRNESDSNGLPNYFAYVRPQLDQLEANRQQSAELQKLRGQIQNLSSGGSGSPQSPRMGASAHYMDTAQFYRGLRR